LEAATTDNHEVFVTVCDSGIGIPDSLSQQIFEPFVSSKPDGIGLGLSICRTIAETHGGRISGYSDGEKGTCFTFSMPMDGRSEPRHAVA
jgi:signal transduction histidine kinase